VRIKGARLLNAVDAGAPSEQRVDLLAIDAEFAAAVPEGEHALASGALSLQRVVLPGGPWAGPPRTAANGMPGGHLVVGGLLVRTVMLQGRPSIELFGPGDFIGGGELAETSGREAVTWTVHQPTELAVIDRRFGVAASRWPGLWQVLVRRTSMRGQRLAAQLAALQLSRVEDRVEEVLWQLADRWGTVTPEGIVVPIALTHQLLGWLVAAKRPTVSIAVAALDERGAVVRRGDGSWLLRNPD
jgi:CRP-like cAMP-binding protein